MNKVIVAFLMIINLSVAHADEYVKRNGALSLFLNNGTAEFNINTSNGNASGVCNIDDTARAVSAAEGQRNRWVYSDSSSACVAVISELNDGSVNVMTRSCENYCGISAVGSMDGKYRIK
ncbi:acyl-CoA dehydrogenase [Salmonella enterica subsp. enterica serovar Agama]|nr:acyl-CoA dehydrogenase [Salmonella enterica]EAA8812189.1 acyl-CoA dehydrogenase [Salmonella enterica subsp. enterica]EAA9213790.1 acyl-CoA dehydrogenase [Salmonella enterica subsp. enterica serovar Agama]EAZ9711106.1 acyl-CoA dehydrogenase [Salmonella enterica subsp. enterica serovar Typhimurium]EBH9100876.1 acyl-CoA dehydrogenase [Salmonella enterica subsp. enterica serovar Colindale]ECF6101817.1 acyl-CoA dehydrogenase [Salmonella enterica subsp. diarizonae]